MSWSRAWVLAVGILGGVMGWPVPEALAGPPGDLDAESRRLIERLTADKALAIARERRLAASAQEARYRQLEDMDRALRAAEARAAGNAAELARVSRERDGIARQWQEINATLAHQDRTLAAQMAVYREAVTGIAMSPDPRKLKALQRFADGEQREALADLD
jgi:hypothetical protein